MQSGNKAKKIISGLLVIAIFLPSLVGLSTPKKADAFTDVPAFAQRVIGNINTYLTGTSTATNTAISIKNAAIEVGKQLLKVLAKRVLAEMTKSTINWINSGFHGKPLFLENPDSFFKNIAKTQVKSLVDMIGYDTFRFPFGRQTALNVIDSYKSQFEINAQYSLSKVINDPDLVRQYRNDFNYGGWNGFLINTQYPQNNYLGFQMIVEQNLASRLQGTLQAPAEKVQTALQQGMGFLSPQICPSNPNWNKNIDPNNAPPFNSAAWERQNPYTGTTAADSLAWEQRRKTAESAWYDTTSCPGGLVSSTPGAVVANQIFTATNTPFLTTALDGALGNSLAAIFDALLNKLIGDGLTSLKTTVNPSAGTDNWSYQGNTLSGGNSGGYNSNTWDGTPSITNSGPLTANLLNVRVKVGQTIISTISGGSGGYEVQTDTEDTRATGVLSGNGFIVTGVSQGSTYAVIKDSAGSTKRINVEVIDLEEISLSTDNISIDVEPVFVTISGGTTPYMVSILRDETGQEVAKATIEGNSMRVIGLKVGQTNIIIQDSSYPPRIIPANVTIITPSPTETTPTTGGTTVNAIHTLGTCTKQDGTTIANISQTTCINNTPGAASWTVNPPTLSCTSVTPKGESGTESNGVSTYGGFVYGVSANVTSVRVAVWSEHNGQDDIAWYDATKYTPVVNAWSYSIDLTKHPVATNNKILAHSYMYSPTISPNGTFCGESYFAKTD